MDKSNTKQILITIFCVCVALVGLVLSAIVWEFIFRIAIILILYVALPIAIIGAIIYGIVAIVKHYNTDK